MTQKKSASSYIREQLEAIEKQMQMGTYQEAICQEINDAGYSITLPAFRKAVMRARQSRNGQAVKSLHQTANAPLIKGKRFSAAELAQLSALQNLAVENLQRP